MIPCLLFSLEQLLRKRHFKVKQKDGIKQSNVGMATGHAETQMRESNGIRVTGSCGEHTPGESMEANVFPVVQLELFMYMSTRV